MNFGALLAKRALIGRDDELAALRTLHEPGGPLVAVVHGVAGSGKSALIRAFAAEHEHATIVDGRAIEPTPAGFEQAAGRHPRLLVIDTFERLRLLDDWLRHTYFPSLPADTRVVIAARDAPGAVWRATFGEYLRVIPLGPLAPADAAAVLEGVGLDPQQAVEVNRFVRGHPLSLQLAASAVKEHPDAVIPTVTQELAALYLDGLDPETRAALDRACVLRRVTRSLLPDGFDRLATLPFVELTPEGLVIHDTVREAVSALLKATDPVRHREHRAAAWRQIRHELPDGGWASIADMIALVEEPLVREAFFPSAVQHYAVETARPSDRDAILKIVARHHPGPTTALLSDWWDAVPDAFRVARAPRGTVVAFAVLCDLRRIPQGLFLRDPVCQAWRAHLRAHPVPKGQRVLAARVALAHGTGSAPSPCFSALLRDVERERLEGVVRRVYAVSGGAELDEQLEPLGYLPIDGGATVCDLGAESVAGWLSELAARDLPVRKTALDPEARELTLDGRTVALTKLECAVLRYLQERQGQVVPRAALLHDVWGYEWAGGANAVDVAICGLRRKLGEHAKRLETVRGVGFRMVPL
ncbi:winged helix-turn-helix domain-containing protein [Solirubrobacter sp. CPCC 204708]|uniref:Winged helix-turn-helix domain-containing protein n=1 Tax=Solirubrobacter deserti TaxID=2282478 RepID=A0ABT4RE98_9ACTN|nr:winged helix-turn-helix domain-containing protein [Solirubrobacter deserti]MBE2316109.1 winged helix-turn-helix domain-containing protein [Solirubrobacter deserti]MDA0136859.1 winged helix-turn-helix domain-containing protein [Solirubrobacter deserti]